MTTLQKIQRIQAVLAELRPLLQQDGGDVELVDLEGDCVWVQLQGACGDCPSRLVTVKDLIQVRLQRVLGPAVVVEALA
ncbi:MAG: NifU family protein [Gloeomargarita sp. GMQP_bins_120]